MAVDVMGMLWVTCENDGAVLIGDAIKKKVVAAIPTVSKGTHWITMLPDSSKIYISSKETPRLSVIDRLTRRVVKEIEMPRGVEGIALSGDGKRLFAADYREPVLWVVDTDKDEVIKQVTLKNVPGRIRVVS